MTSAQRVAGTDAVFYAERVAADLAIVGEVRPEIGPLLEDVGVTRNMQRLLNTLGVEASAQQRSGIRPATVAPNNTCELPRKVEDANL